MEQREEKVPVTAIDNAVTRVRTYIAKEMENEPDGTAWDFLLRLWYEARKMAEEVKNNPSRKTYWKVEVEAYDYGAVLAAITGSEERETPPEEVRQFERHGMTVTELWFDDKDKAEAFVANIRRPGN